MQLEAECRYSDTSGNLVGLWIAIRQLLSVDFFQLISLFYKFFNAFRVAQY